MKAKSVNYQTVRSIANIADMGDTFVSCLMREIPAHNPERERIKMFAEALVGMAIKAMEKDR